MTAPCKDCPDRRAHCHSCCEKYKAFCDENERLRTKNNTEKVMTQYQCDTKCRLYFAKHRKNKKRS